MQKKIIALAVAALASSAAFAQSNVTIYGIADVGYAHMHADGKQSQNNIDSGLLAGSRIGFKGAEDLGNGLKALFTLEYALAMDANAGIGQQDSPWSSSATRQSFVGLSSDKLGTLVAGRLQTAGYDFACAYSPVAGGAFNTTDRIGAATVISCGSGGRANNAVAYISPSFAGVTVALNHAQLTENQNVVGSVGENTFADLVQVSYNNGPLSASAIWSHVNGGDNVNGINGGSTTVAKDINEYGLGISYDLKVVKLSALYQSQKSHAAPTATSAGAPLEGERNSKWSVGAAVPVSAAGTVLVSYAASYINQTTAPDNAKAASVVYTHGLSKRTKLYAGYTFVKNDGAADHGGNNPVYGAVTTSPQNPIAGGNASILGAGINHAF